MKNGLLKNDYDLRDYSYERTFGSVDLSTLPEEYNADLALDFPDQNADGYPNGCTGYTQTETGQDEYGVPFLHPFIYEKTLLMKNLPPNSPCKIRDSLKATRVYGLKPRKGDVTPETYRRGAYFDVDKVGDYFDGVRSALWLNRLQRRTITVGTPWYWGNTQGSDGILRAPPKYVWDAGTIGHNYKICGWKVIKNEPYLIVKPWLGPRWGDKGYGYLSREVFNKIMNISGTAMYIQANPGPADVQPIKLDIMEAIVSFLRQLFEKKREELPPPPAPEPEKPKELSRREKLYVYAKSCLGSKRGLDKSVKKELNCANALTHILILFGIQGLPTLGIAGTAALYNWLNKSPEFEKVKEPLPGDVAIFPTGTGNGKIRGHVFIVGFTDWMSNNSATGLWEAHWKKDEAIAYYVSKGGLKQGYFRVREK